MSFVFDIFSFPVQSTFPAFIFWNLEQVKAVRLGVGEGRKRFEEVLRELHGWEQQCLLRWGWGGRTSGDMAKL